MAGVAAVLCLNGDRIDGAILDRCPDLRLVAMASVGYDSVDVEAAHSRGVRVSNCPQVLSETVADATFGLIIWARRLFGAAERDIRGGRWVDNRLDSFLGLDVHGATLGIAGFGSIGRAVAERAAAFAMPVLVSDPRPVDRAHVRQVSLDELLAESDVVSLHVPLGEATRGLIGERELRLMKPTATLINTSRGGVVDETALLRALREGWIHSAGLDVQQHEPNSDPSHPLLSLPNLVVLPHVASATFAARASMVDLAVDNVVAFIEGRPLLTPVPADTSPQLMGASDAQAIGGPALR